jgi:hypothetical protein
MQEGQHKNVATTRDGTSTGIGILRIIRCVLRARRNTSRQQRLSLIISYHSSGAGRCGMRTTISHCAVTITH